MSTRSSISAPGALDLKSYSEVLQWATEKTRSSSNQRTVVLRVYRWNTQIWMTGTFHLSYLGMKNVLDSLVLRFVDMPHGLRFVITSWTASNTFPVVTTSTINNLLTFRFVPTKGALGKLEIVIRSSEKIGLLLKSIRSSERRVLGSNALSVIGATGDKHFPRVNPVNRSVAITVRSCTQLGCNTSPSGTLATFYRGFTSVNTPGFVTKRKTGQLPVNPYSLSRAEIQPGKYFVVEDYGNGTFFTADYNVHPHLTFADIPSGHLTVDENSLIAKIRGRITATAKIGEDIATGAQTARLLSVSLDRFKTFLQLVTGKQKIETLDHFLGRARGKQRFLKAVRLLRKDGINGAVLLSRLWLEHRYGWLPLIEDVQQVIVAFQQYAGKNSDLARVSGSRVSKTENVRSVIYADNPYSVPNTKRRRYFYENVRTVCKMGFTYKMDAKMLATVNGLGLTNPLSLAWDLAPYSFVVDWFLPIGPALDAISAFQGLSFVRGYKTYFTESTVLLVVDQSYSQAGGITYSEKGNSFGKRVMVNRTALTSFPGPVIPRFKNPYSLVHAANAAALITLILTGNKIRTRY